MRSQDYSRVSVFSKLEKQGRQTPEVGSGMRSSGICNMTRCPLTSRLKHGTDVSKTVAEVDANVANVYLVQRCVEAGISVVAVYSLHRVRSR